MVDSFEFIESSEGEEDERLIGGEGSTPLRMTLKNKDAAGELVDAGALEADLYLACLGRKPRARATSRSSPSEAADGGVCLSVAASGSQSSKPATAQSPPGSRRESATLASPSGVLALIGPS